MLAPTGHPDGEITSAQSNVVRRRENVYTDIANANDTKMRAVPRLRNDPYVTSDCNA